MLKFVFLTDDFYNDYKDCKEIERKRTRPLIKVQLEVDGVLFCVPLRSNISHPYVLWTDKENRCGLDFSKAVVITAPERYIDREGKPYIRPKEFKALKGKDRVAISRMRRCIAEYKEAKKHPEIERNKYLLQYSTLQYFEGYI